MTDEVTGQTPWTRERLEAQLHTTRQFLLGKGLSEERVEVVLWRRERAWRHSAFLWENRQRAKDEYGHFYAEVLAILTRRDPMHIIFEDNPEAAKTEYDAEAGHIVLGMIAAPLSREDVLRALHEVFGYWFGPNPRVSPSDYAAIADDIRQAWQRDDA